jgi:acetyltransferase-like isoleucine patch superfamily enzyme
MRNWKRRLLQTSFALVGIPRAFAELARTEARLLYLRHRYPGVDFSRGCNADDLCIFGEKVKVLENTILSKVRVGSYSYVGGNSVLKNCSVGKFCSLGSEVKIGLGIHPVAGVISSYPGFYSASASGAVKFNHNSSIEEYKQVVVGNDVWIGTRAMILDGVTVGDGAIIAAGSVVTKDIEPYNVVGGVPAKLIRKRYSQEEVQQLVDFAWWDKGEEFCRENSELFLNSETFLQMIRSTKVLSEVQRSFTEKSQ